MDRRRFVPSGDGLERRELLSSVGGTALIPTKGKTTQVDTLPETFKAKEQRILNLPYFLNSFQPGRYLPPDTLKQIQGDLLQVATTLHAAPTSAINNFNLTLRHAMPYSTLSPNTAKLLNRAFTVVIAQSGADPAYVQSLSTAMNQLALVDSKSVDQSYLARNDYALVLQTTLAVGRPIQTPSRSEIAPKDGKSVSPYQGYTYHNTPALVGTYTVGATTNASTLIKIFAGNLVIATGAVQSNGRYSAQVVTPLADGTYKLVARAVDEFGHISKPSKPFLLRVATRPGTTTPQAQTLTVTATPGGPLGLG
jgi:hypothetical protein